MRRVLIGPQDALPDFENCYDGLILHLLELYGFQDPPPQYVKSVLRNESMFNPLAVSPTGAEGLGQLVDSTWTGLDKVPVTKEPTTDIFTNVSRTIRNLSPLFPWARKVSTAADVLCFVAAGYNLGPGNVQRSQAWADAAGADPMQWGNVALVIAPALVQHGWTEQKAKDKQVETSGYVERITDWCARYAPDFAGKKAEG